MHWSSRGQGGGGIVSAIFPGPIGGGVEFFQQFTMAPLALFCPFMFMFISVGFVVCCCHVDIESLLIGGSGVHVMAVRCVCVHCFLPYSHDLYHVLPPLLAMDVYSSLSHPVLIWHVKIKASSLRWIPSLSYIMSPLRRITVFALLGDSVCYRNTPFCL